MFSTIVLGERVVIIVGEFFQLENGYSLFTNLYGYILSIGEICESNWLILPHSGSADMFLDYRYCETKFDFDVLSSMKTVLIRTRVFYNCHVYMFLYIHILAIYS